MWWFPPYSSRHLWVLCFGYFTMMKLCCDYSFFIRFFNWEGHFKALKLYERMHLVTTNKNPCNNNEKLSRKRYSLTTNDDKFKIRRFLWSGLRGRNAGSWREVMPFLVLKGKREGLKILPLLWWVNGTPNCIDFLFGKEKVWWRILKNCSQEIIFLLGRLLTKRKIKPTRLDFYGKAHRIHTKPKRNLYPLPLGRIHLPQARLITSGFNNCKEKRCLI